MSVEASVWTFRIKDSSGTLVANLVKIQKRQIKLGLNKAGEAYFTYDLKDFYDLATTVNLTVKSLLGVGRNTLECVRNDEVIFAGQIVNANIKMDTETATLEVKVMGWFWLLGFRFAGLTSDKTYSSTDAGSIAWDLIDTTQNLTYGDLGITQGTIQTSINRTLTYTRKNIKEAIEDLSGADNGFDFEITPTKVFNVYYPIKGIDRTSTVIFRYPGNIIKSIEEVNDASNLANSVLAIGSGFGLQEINVQKDDISAQSVYTLKQRIKRVKDLNNAVVLGDIAQQEIDVYASINPYFRLKLYGGNGITPSVEDFSVGDTIRLIIDKSFWSEDQDFRIFEIYITIDELDVENVELVIGLI